MVLPLLVLLLLFWLCFCHCTLSIFVKCFLNSFARVANHRPSSNCWETHTSEGETISRIILLLTRGDDTSRWRWRWRWRLWIEYRVSGIASPSPLYFLFFAQPTIDRRWQLGSATESACATATATASASAFASEPDCVLSLMCNG